MKLYRIKHKPTGLYWRNSRNIHNQKRDQLTEEGRVYTVVPDLRWLGHDKVHLHHNKQNLILDLSEFEVEELDQ